MDLFWQINPEEMLSGLMVTTFLILLDASVVVVCSMVMFPLIDLAFKKKAKPAPAQVEPWHHDGPTAHHAELSGPPWLATRSKFLRPDAVPHFQLMSYPTAQERAVERITPLNSSITGVERFRGRAARSCNGTADAADLKLQSCLSKIEDATLRSGASRSTFLMEPLALSACAPRKTRRSTSARELKGHAWILMRQSPSATNVC
jgi:hypothetical protein